MDSKRELLPTLQFCVIPFSEFVEVGAWCLEQDGILNICDRMKKLYPELKSVTDTRIEKDTLEVVLQKEYNEEQLSQESERFREVWAQYHEDYLDQLARFFEIQWQDAEREFTCYVCLSLPVFPRSDDNTAFYLSSHISSELLIETIAHELCHFAFFQKCKALFPGAEERDFSEPSPVWLLSEILIDPVLNRAPFRKIFSQKIRSYDYFYEIVIDGKPLMETISAIFDNLPVAQALGKSYLYISEHMNEICPV